MGTVEGNIPIYYLDEPILDKETGVAIAFKEKYHTMIHFEKPLKGVNTSPSSRAHGMSRDGKITEVDNEDESSI